MKRTLGGISDAEPGSRVLASCLGAPFGLLVFEPMHFAMERGMLLGIEASAESMV